MRASFLAFFALIFYYDLFGPDVPGLSFGPTFENRKGQMVVLSPPMNPAFERARAKTGYYVVSVDGQEVYTDSDWLAVAANLEVGRPVRLGIERGARHFEVQTTFERNQILGSLFRASFLPTEASRFLMLVVSLFIAFSRPYNLSARLGALILAAAAVNPPCYLPYGAAAGWRHLSVPVGAPLWVPCISRFVLGPLMCTLLAVFPRRLFRARWPWAVVWAPALLVVPSDIRYTFAMLYQPSQITGVVPGWVIRMQFPLLAAYCAAALRFLR